MEIKQIVQMEAQFEARRRGARAPVEIYASWPEQDDVLYKKKRGELTQGTERVSIGEIVKRRDKEDQQGEEELEDVADGEDYQSRDQGMDLGLEEDGEAETIQN